MVDGFNPIGPILPIEFCRVSGNDNPPRRLTLVIDDDIGVQCQTYVALSAFDDLEAARENLRSREGLAHVNGIGFAVKGGASSARAIERHPKAVMAIEAWLAASDFDAVIWTALANNFAERAGEAFSVEASIRFLEAQPEEHLPRALEYIRKAPEPVQTPVRAAVSARWPQV
ncbi:hypothetical protein [Paenirhodobacter populi]|uniref:hypothetical protein n=1 Tax=Paenirhodobacter populi TaxID=2306993 RepID=UPI0019D4BF4F|nr:hypothetical protein [Sinirhodobacter populi]